MQWLEILCFGILIISSFTTGVFAIYSNSRGQASSIRTFSILLAVVTLYTVSYLFQLTSKTVPAMLFWFKFQLIDISLIPPLWIISVVQYIGMDKWLTKKNIGLLFIIPILTVFFSVTNYHGFYYQSITIGTEGPFTRFETTKGLWFWFFMIYLDFACLMGIGLLLKFSSGKKSLFRRQVIIIVLCMIIPWTAQLVFLSGYSPWHLDLTPFALTLTGLMLGLGVFRYQMLNLEPIARDKIFQSLRDGLLVLDIQDRIVDYNPALTEILTPIELGRHISEGLRDYPLLINQIASRSEYTTLQIPQSDELEYYESRLVPILNHKGVAVGQAIIFKDITDQVLLLDKLQQLVAIDELTQVYNRRAFMERCRDENNRLARLKRPVSVIFIDVDHFKQINDTLGHPTGDLTLQTIVQKIRSGLRETDILGRIGGEEFAVLLPETRKEQALEIAERVRQIIDKPICLNERVIMVTISFGITSIPQAIQGNVDYLFKKADEALYLAKHAGRNCVRVVEMEIGE